MGEIVEVKHESKIASVFSTVVRVVAYPVAAVSGWLAGDVHIRNSIYKNFAKHGMFDGTVADKLKKGGVQGQLHRTVIGDVQDTYKKALANASSDAQAERLAVNAVAYSGLEAREVEGILRGAGKAVPENIAGRAKTLLEEAISSLKGEETLMSDLSKKANTGYRKVVRHFFEDMKISGPKGLFNAANRNQKVEAAIVFLTVAGISLGGLLSAANSRGLLDALSAKHNKENGSAVTQVSY